MRLPTCVDGRRQTPHSSTSQVTTISRSPSLTCRAAAPLSPAGPNVWAPVLSCIVALYDLMQNLVWGAGFGRELRSPAPHAACETRGAVFDDVGDPGGQNTDRDQPRRAARHPCDARVGPQLWAALQHRPDLPRIARHGEGMGLRRSSHSSDCIAMD